MRIFIAAVLIILLGGHAFAQGVSGCGGVSTAIACRPSTIVASLPTCNAGSQGVMFMVTDALTPTSLNTVANGGAAHVGVICNGTNWIVQ